MRNQPGTIPTLADHDRPLAPRGAEAATLIGRELRKDGFRADCILCSTARRAVDTLEIVTAQLDGDALEMPVHQERELYLTGENGAAGTAAAAAGQGRDRDAGGA